MGREYIYEVGEPVGGLRSFERTGEVVRCRDCKHRPIKGDGNIVYAPNDIDGWDDETCPCLCEDCYYNWMPEDDFFCKRGERRGKMPRYIDADAMKKDLEENYVFVGFADLLNDIIDAIDAQPTADCVEVRCKDCKFWGESLTKEERNECGVCADLVCTYWMSDGLTRDDFCSKGERREDAEVH